VILTFDSFRRLKCKPNPGVEKDLVYIGGKQSVPLPPIAT